MIVDMNATEMAIASSVAEMASDEFEGLHETFIPAAHELHIPLLGQSMAGIKSAICFEAARVMTTLEYVEVVPGQQKGGLNKVDALRLLRQLRDPWWELHMACDDSVGFSDLSNTFRMLFKKIDERIGHVWIDWEQLFSAKESSTD